MSDDNSSLDSDSAAFCQFMACTIEASVHAMHDSDNDKAKYAEKARSLVFNLKNNENLRLSIIDGSIPADHVVHMKAAELKTSDQQKKEKEDLDRAVAERRGDADKIARDQLMLDNGLDPNKGGEFTCSKCKGTKTTHYQMQTRSADEPMTVFVRCLTCGKRWRTQ